MISSSQSGPFMKSIRPPGARHAATRSSVSGIDATARVITPATRSR